MWRTTTSVHYWSYRDMPQWQQNDENTDQRFVCMPNHKISWHWNKRQIEQIGWGRIWWFSGSYYMQINLFRSPWRWDSALAWFTKLSTGKHCKHWCRASLWHIRSCASSVQRNHTMPWWRNQMETFSALLAICAGNSPVSGEFPAQMASNAENASIW